jgi:O-acetyl-ADP-ribose deacetylase (regulator of RNase III)
MLSSLYFQSYPQLFYFPSTSKGFCARDEGISWKTGTYNSRCKQHSLVVANISSDKKISPRQRGTRRRGPCGSFLRCTCCFPILSLRRVVGLVPLQRFLNSAVKDTKLSLVPYATTMLPSGWTVLKAYRRQPLLPDIILVQGSVVDYETSAKPAAIVNAANEGCLCGRGVDGAISDAGGSLLAQHRLALPVLNRPKTKKRKATMEVKTNGGDYDDGDDKDQAHATSKRIEIEAPKDGNGVVTDKLAASTTEIEAAAAAPSGEEAADTEVEKAVVKGTKEYESSSDHNSMSEGSMYDESSDEFEGAPVRCWTGSAVITGPGQYGDLKVDHVIHAVGPNYWNHSFDADRAHSLLRSAYTASLDLAAQHELHGVAFSLLSAGVFRGRLPLSVILSQGMSAIVNWDKKSKLETIYVCAYNEKECDILCKAGNHLLANTSNDNETNTASDANADSTSKETE